MRRALTLLEVMMVLGIVRVLATSGGWVLGNVRARQAQAAAVEELTAAFKRAHIFSREAKGDRAWGVKYRNDRSYVLISGVSDLPQVEEEHDVPDPARISSGPFEVWFDPGTGESSSGVEVTVTTTRGGAKIISVSKTGLIEVQ